MVCSEAGGRVVAFFWIPCLPPLPISSPFLIPLLDLESMPLSLSLPSWLLCNVDSPRACVRVILI